MAIQFARCAYVSRSTGGNACRKASYNQRDVIRCERTGELFSFKERGGNVHHEIMLPDGANEKFKNSSVLWNEVERCEKRKDSQLQKEFVIALPDDTQVTFEDRLELTRRFVNTHFVEKGLGVQLDIHEPDEEEKNWHAHLLITTRRFSEDGLSFEKIKARDLDPTIKKGFVVEADVWGELWRDLQNTYFEEKGYDLKVDPIAIVPQEHLGPVRMRHHMNDAIARSQLLQKANEQLSQDPGSVLEALTRNRAVFSEKDVDHFLKKHVGMEERKQVVEEILHHPSLVPLYNKETGDKTTYFTTKEVRTEEDKLLRFAASVEKRSVSSLSPEAAAKGLEGRAFSEEQLKAYELCVQSGQNLSLIQGRAGVGKSYVLAGIRMAHEEEGYRVIGLAPTHKVTNDMLQSGFKEAKTCHSFLFALKHGKMALNSNTLVVIDEAGMLGTELSVELFHAVKTSGAKLVLVGDDRQLSSIERGGAFRALLDRYESAELKDVRRQTISWQKAVSEDLSRGDVKSAVQTLHQNDRIDWKDTREEALTSLLKAWAEDSQTNPPETWLILAQKNVEVDALNLGVRDILRAQGKLGDVELICMTSRGKAAFAVGDRIQLTKTDKEQGLINGKFGMIEQIDETAKTMTVCFDSGEKQQINPSTYDGLRHGYASTVYRAQGATLKHVYGLHSNTTNQATNYVTLTRQTHSLSLFVSRDETPTEVHLIRQMSREEGKGTSLAFDTLRDIKKRQQDRSFSAHIKDGVENLVTKVKDVFHKNEAFYQFDKPLAQTGEVSLISPSLQAVYEDWKHPAFARAANVQQAFEKGLKIHGEEKAIAYWASKKGELLQNYQQNLTKIDKELNAPLFNCRSDQWKDQARELAKQDPTRVLNLIQQLKDDATKQERIIPAQPVTPTPQVNPTEEKYLQFKTLYGALKDNPNPPAAFQEDLKRLGKEVFQDKEFMKHLKLLERNEAKNIERMVQEKQRVLELDRGGLSL